MHVFPIRVPPLRERRENIAQLAEHFVRLFAERYGKVVPDIPSGVIDALKHHDWPGNVRELQNVIERAVVTTRGGVLEVPQVGAESTGRASLVIDKDACTSGAGTHSFDTPRDEWGNRRLERCRREAWAVEDDADCQNATTRDLKGQLKSTT